MPTAPVVPETSVAEPIDIALDNTAARIAELCGLIMWTTAPFQVTRGIYMRCQRPFSRDNAQLGLALQHVACLPAALTCTSEDPARSRMVRNFLAEMMHHLLGLLD